ncbi:uncharacterized protein I206_102060 [Kwoniella pini CBS 10737]|uniref:Carboxylic ester hydrolase n=1 Tax=Kwoniella pini CBS 10737 TaxID=1296096 RepID=A0A1B9HUY6_9TREE|nr:uncharacterized protein I206_06847 [Kwoniella pini CBS 10737]OCF47073.1 hypothetical protein I206_06847 [Kwoniella pini CBS 10737]
MKWTLILPLLPFVFSAPAPQEAEPSSAISSAASGIISAVGATATGTATAASSTTTGSSISGNSTSVPSNTTTSTNPSVTIYPDTSNGNPIQITGLNYPQFNQDAYLGIPFALPPTGDKRFEAPQSYIYNFSVTAQTPPPACLQAPTSTIQIQSEDCLFLNVIAPQGANAQTTWLPVMVWVYGGSFTSGSANLYNATLLEAFAEKTNRPFIFVALNYRLGTFGWPSGSGFAENGAANLGLKDIKKGLEWVQENIWAFGGNPDQVTVFGESAGAIAISLLYLDENINTFKGAIMESGAQSTAPIGPTASTWEDAYQYLLQVTNCSGQTTAQSSSSANSTSSSGNATTSSVPSTGSNSSSTALTGYECLKALPAEALLKGQLAVKQNILFSGFVYAPTIDGDLIPDSPHTLLSQGKFAKIPFISGNNKDEGTAFVPSFIDSTALGIQLINILEPVDPDNTTISQLFTLYPDIASLGSPFDTGNETFGKSSAYKQISAIIGDSQFQANRRYFLEKSNDNGLNQIWTYQFEQLTNGVDPSLGIYHSSEIPFVFGATIPGLNLTLNSFGNNYTSEDEQFSNIIMNYWLNFAYYNNPNSPSGINTSNSTFSNITNWPTYDGNSKNILRLKSNNITVFKDDYRKEQMDFFINNPKQFNYKRNLIQV